jgi:prepilin-type N-terminal cleavage/methylation domain
LNADRGFTLIEMVVAIALFTITMVYGLSFFTYGAQSALRAEVRREALQQCNAIIEQHKGTVFSSEGVSVPYNPAAINVGPGGAARITQYVSAYAHSKMPSVTCRLIETTATWKSTSKGLVHLIAIQAPNFGTY